MSPHCNSVPHSSHTDRFTEPLLSATRHERTSWPSFVLFGFPKRKKAGNILPSAPLYTVLLRREGNDKSSFTDIKNDKQGMDVFGARS